MTFCYYVYECYPTILHRNVNLVQQKRVFTVFHMFRGGSETRRNPRETHCKIQLNLTNWTFNYHFNSLLCETQHELILLHSLSNWATCPSESGRRWGTRSASVLSFWTQTLQTAGFICLMIWPVWNMETQISSFLIIQRDTQSIPELWTLRASAQGNTAGRWRLEIIPAGFQVLLKSQMTGRRRHLVPHIMELGIKVENKLMANVINIII